MGLACLRLFLSLSSVEPQFYKQMMVDAISEKATGIGPTSRAENTNTANGLTDLTELDSELAFREDYR